MLDHVLLELVQTIRSSFADALLTKQDFDERLQVDILSGDSTWEVSYTLPGEGNPPHVQCDVSVDFPAWSQAAFRSWQAGDEIEDYPELEIEVLLRLQGLAAAPDLAAVAAALPDRSPSLGDEALIAAPPAIEQLLEDDLSNAGYGVEFAYDGYYRIGDDALRDRAVFARELGQLGPWVASTLVRLGDLRLEYLPGDEDAE